MRERAGNDEKYLIADLYELLVDYDGRKALQVKDCWRDIGMMRKDNIMALRRKSKRS